MAEYVTLFRSGMMYRNLAKALLSNNIDRNLIPVLEEHISDL